ncbi:hypothetical protein FRACYDRAFT_237350 [Fragilariopsis cylindrus CCMP1102]|uniref:CAAX prenyl protease 2/Lysostaphin resistance protein A-like domain-containing protein n=1 Tax=Fragilariopsis cylindrus CCMP1102 TaxID=635003 RepID=A0A1E7FLL0_9STRA|nr:hypothetical protein FRACYDRAFT_237350 [Fragilariopsis cylindrus CCMP1102]|eukprot:OEU19059.1 hypothetical protein FRACYDRAFT_237350 [Fragilariopsis cylindrus CCMP1102]
MTAGSSSSNGIGFTSVQGLSLSTSTVHIQSQSQSQSQRRQRRQSSLSLFNDATNHNTFSSSSTKSSRRHTNWYRQHQHLSNRRRPTTTIASSASSTTTTGGAAVDVDDDSVSPSSASASSSLKRRMIQILTGQKIINSSSSSSSFKRPKCLQSIIDNNKNDKNKSKYNITKKIIKLIPIWIFHLRSSTQLIITFLIYIFHTVVLTQQSLLFPFQIIGNNRGYYSSIGYDTLAGMITLGLYQYIRRNQKSQESTKSDTSTTIKSETSTTITTTMLLSEDDDDKESLNSDNDNDEETYVLPNLLSKPMTKDMPWKNIWNSKYSRISSGFTFLILVRTYFFTGRISLFWEDFLYGYAKYATWMTVPMHKSLTVLLGHTSWIVLASIILRLIPRPQSFFQQPTSMWFTSQYKNKNKNNSSSSSSSMDKNKPESQLQPKPQQQQWIWWVLGGYFVSCWFYNISDILNSYIFPLGILQLAEENSVVGSLLNTYDIKASLVGYIAPCITAPWFEEILYRGYLLPTLLLWLPSKSSKSRQSFQSKNTSNPSSSSSSKDSDTNSKTNSFSYQLAIFISGILFSVHHQSELAFIPLCILGWLWAIIYTKSGNLWTTILIHSMWNSRIFIGGWFGL